MSILHVEASFTYIIRTHTHNFDGLFIFAHSSHIRPQLNVTNDPNPD